MECKNCKTTIPDDVAGETHIPQGEQVFMYKYRGPSDVATTVNYYCSANCLSADVGAD